MCLRLRGPVFNVPCSNVRVPILDEVPGAHVDHDKAADGPCQLTPFRWIFIERQRAKHGPQRARQARPSPVTEPSAASGVNHSNPVHMARFMRA
jgi:hypothetical protein